MTRAGKHVLCAKRGNTVTETRAGNTQRVLSAKNMLPFSSTGKLGKQKLHHWSSLVHDSEEKKPVSYWFMNNERHS